MSNSTETSVIVGQPTPPTVFNPDLSVEETAGHPVLFYEGLDRSKRSQLSGKNLNAAAKLLMKWALFLWDRVQELQAKKIYNKDLTDESVTFNKLATEVRTKILSGKGGSSNDVVSSGSSIEDTLLAIQARRRVNKSAFKSLRL